MVGIIVAVAEKILPVGAFAIGVFYLGSLVPFKLVATGRPHDNNRSGWWQLIIFSSIIGGVQLLLLMCIKGTLGENKFGDDPLVTSG